MEKNKRSQVNDSRGYLSIDRTTALKANLELIKGMSRPANNPASVPTIGTQENSKVGNSKPAKK